MKMQECWFLSMVIICSYLILKCGRPGYSFCVVAHLVSFCGLWSHLCERKTGWDTACVHLRFSKVLWFWAFLRVWRFSVFQCCSLFLWVLKTLLLLRWVLSLEACYNILWALEHHSAFLYNLVLRVLSRVPPINVLPPHMAWQILFGSQLYSRPGCHFAMAARGVWRNMCKVCVFGVYGTLRGVDVSNIVRAYGFLPIACWVLARHEEILTSLMIS